MTNPGIRLQVSTDGVTFAPALFPLNVQLDVFVSDLAYAMMCAPSRASVFHYVRVVHRISVHLSGWTKRPKVAHLGHPFQV